MMKSTVKEKKFKIIYITAVAPVIIKDDTAEPMIINIQWSMDDAVVASTGNNDK